MVGASRGRLRKWRESPSIGGLVSEDALRDRNLQDGATAGRKKVSIPQDVGEAIEHLRVEATAFRRDGCSNGATPIDVHAQGQRTQGAGACGLAYRDSARGGKPAE